MKLLLPALLLLGGAFALPITISSIVKKDTPSPDIARLQAGKWPPTPSKILAFYGCETVIDLRNSAESDATAIEYGLLE